MGARGSRAGVLMETGNTASCSIYVQGGLKGTCQDSVLAVESLFPDHVLPLLGVFDGHGHAGHEVSVFVRDNLAVLLRDHVEDQYDSLRAKSVGGVAGSAEAVALWRPLLEKAFASVDKDVEKKLAGKCTDSGSTAVVALRQDKNLVVAHAGDSRCVLGRTTYDDSNTSGQGFKIAPVQLTHDHKAGDPGEKARVHAAGGRVLRLMNTVDRLFVPGKNEPGLAVSRAFGDYDLKGHGLISTPAVMCHEIKRADEFIVLASDGVWDVMSNEEVVQTVWDTKQRGKAAKAVVQKAVSAWATSRHANMRDDISAVIYFF